MRGNLTGVAILSLALALTACAGGKPAVKSPETRRAPTSRPSAEALVVALQGERGEHLVAADARLVALGEASVPALTRALGTATGEPRLRILGVLDELGRVPSGVDAEERVDVILWRLAGGNGGAAERTVMLARLPAVGPEIRSALAGRASRPGPDRPLAIFGLAVTGDARAVEVLSSALAADEDDVRGAAAAGLERLTGVNWLEAGVAERARLLREWGSDVGGRQG